MHANGDQRGAGHSPDPAEPRPTDDAPQPDAPVKYRVISRIARSPHDARYLVQRLDTERIALAELRVLSSDLGASAGLVRAFTEQAARLAAAARGCPGIASVYECERVARGALLLAVERPPGATLREVLEADGRLAVPRAVRIAIQIAEALEQAHALGLVHGGLHPDNVVLCGPVETASLTHFGFDRLLGAPARSGPPLAVDGRAYQAPEQASGKTTARSDIYALGAMLYEMLAGTPPAHARDTRPGPGNLRAVRPDVTPTLERLVLQTLRVSPRLRPGSVSAVCTRLWAEASPYGRPSAPESQRSWAGAVLRRPVLLVASVAAAAVLTAGALVVWLGHGVETAATRPATRATGDERVPPIAVPRPPEARPPRVDRPREAVEPKSTAAQREAAEPTRALAPAAGSLASPADRRAAESPAAGNTGRTESRPPAILDPERSAAARRSPERAQAPETSRRGDAPPGPDARREESRPASPGAPAEARPVEPGRAAGAVESGRASNPSPTPRPAERSPAPPSGAPARATATQERATTPRDAEDPGAIIDWLLGEGSRPRR
jgi:eukaryotic-like serine/threonine-protein kinase